MAKTMARLENNIVTNIEWCSDRTAETEYLKEAFDYPVGIGDTYYDGRFYRDGVLILSAVEELQQQIAELDNAYEEGVRSA